MKELIQVSTEKLASHVSLIWNIAEILRGDYKEHEYGDVVLPFTVLTRLDSVLVDTKQAVLGLFIIEGVGVVCGVRRVVAG